MERIQSMQFLSGIMSLLSIPLFIGCKEDDQQPINSNKPCTPHYVEPSLIWGGYWDDCTSHVGFSPETFIIFERIRKKTLNDENFIVGDTIKAELYYRGFPYKFDSLSFKICNNIFEKNISYNQILEPSSDYSQGINGIAWRGQFVLDESLNPGLYQYSTKVWKDGYLIWKAIKDIFIYPRYEIELSCKIEGKKTLIIEVPNGTPQKSKIQILENYKSWIYEDDSIFTLTPIDEYRYCIAIDFRGGENFRFILNEDNSKCSKQRNFECTKYLYDLFLENNGIEINTIEAWGNTIEPEKVFICKIE